jgi:hypothetical protein
MKINVKNNSTANVAKIDFVKEFLRFCQINSPLKSSIDVVFVDRSNQVFFDGKYLVPIKFTKLKDSLSIVSKFWIEEFSKQRKINCVGVESELLTKFFIEKNPSVSKFLNL